MYIDTHAHLDQFNNDLSEIMQRAKTFGVEKIITLGCNIGSAKRSLEIANEYPHVYSAIGIHPCDILFDEQQTKQLLQLEALFAEAKKLRAVGEIGLDYYWMNVPKEAQREVFRYQLQLAKNYNLPVVIHCRNPKEEGLNAYEEALAILLEEGIDKAVFHCYANTIEFARKVWDKGYFTSFTGIVTYPKAEMLREVILEAPLDGMMIETDSPFLAPQSKRGRRNEPGFLPEIGEKIAEIRKEDQDTIQKALFANSLRFFSI